MTDDWAAALDAAARVRVTVVVGTSDTGKTTLVARLASALAADAPVAVVDADLGQSEIGPPTTVGLGRVVGTVPRLGAAEFVAARFVGATTPVRCIRELSAATGALVERARRSGYRRILVDTCGLVAGPFGVAVKRALVDAVAADTVLAVQRADECAGLARVLAERRSVVALRAAAAVVRRTQEQRRRRRAELLARHLAGAREIVLDPTVVSVRAGCGRKPDDDVTDAIVGLEDAHGEFLGVGRLRAIDADTRGLVVETAVSGGRIAAATIGEAKMQEAGATRDAPA